MKMTLKKIEKASVSYGRGSDSGRKPAAYAVYVEPNGENSAGGIKVGVIRGSFTGYMEPTRWEFYSDYAALKGVPMMSTRKALVEAVERRLIEEGMFSIKTVIAGLAEAK